ncbi:uncharacterized protein LOC130720679 [Lotus japonicus]|uniref:uncharacterized protein LOC130720679 n=1 Tax=Lotus japonicus TaxID=34305 RepID=UPI002586107D|nr:uncharacterized protein LOC130720679 [Lotus japonicus]
MAILEPRISGNQAEKVISKLGFDEHVKSEAKGFSGGIWCCWNKASISVHVISIQHQCIHLHINPNENGGWFLSITYANPQERFRQSLWEDLIVFKDQIQGPWCVTVDFNSILFESEKMGGAPINQAAANRFLDCLNVCGLESVDAHGTLFTWQRGNLRERLDRSVVNSVWRTTFPNVSVTNLPLPFSDQRAQWIRMRPLGRGPKPFKFIASWISHSEFKDQITQNWRPSDSWLNNIERCTEQLKTWNQTVFGNIFFDKKRILARLQGIQKALSTAPNPHLLKLKNVLWNDYDVILRREEVYWAQLGVSKRSTICRQQFNRVEALLDNHGTWIYDNCGIQTILRDFFSSLYESDTMDPFDFHSAGNFPKVTRSDQERMISTPSLEEIKQALFSIGNLKSPGPDGYHALFFKHNWDTLKESISLFVNRIFLQPKLIEEVNATVIALIPKVKVPERANQFRPIALCNTSYKLVTKLLASHLSEILPKLIAPNQSSFIKGRSTVDNVLILQEVIHSFKSLKGKKGFMAIKLDLEKAYDRIQWPFIANTLRFFGFDDTFINLIEQCISTSSIAIAWRGEYLDSFKPSRGIRQGDPISPYLFVLCMERLGHLIQDACGNDTWKPYVVGRSGPKLSHLMFADDVILLAEASMDQAKLLQQTLTKFCNSSGQRLSLPKSRVLF